MKYPFAFLFTALILQIPRQGICQMKPDPGLYFKRPQKPPASCLRKNVLNQKNLFVFGGLLASSFLVDEWVDNHLKSNQNRFLDGYSDFFNEFGEKKIIAPATVATAAIGMAIKDKRLSNTAFNSGKALLTGAILTESIKIVAGRSRPDLNLGNMHFDAFGGTSNDTKSLPSGHVFVAWSVFTPFAEEYSRWIYVIPVSVSFARAYKNRHWLSDVVLGGGIGYFAGFYFHKRKNQKVIFSGNGIVVRF